jgi:small conductance mechanosensitive channel
MSCATYVIRFIAILEIMKVGFDVDVTSILAAAGVVGLAIGFGAQSLVKDFITGFFILLENQYCVGEEIQIGTFKGEVRELGLRTTRVRNEEGQELYIPNGMITQVINLSRKAVAVDESADE